jgi:hypothetical protein
MAQKNWKALQFYVKIPEHESYFLLRMCLFTSVHLLSSVVGARRLLAAVRVLVLFPVQSCRWQHSLVLKVIHARSFHPQKRVHKSFIIVVRLVRLINTSIKL